MDTSTGLDVMVIGAGVSGLTTAVQLAEHGYRVGVLAERPPDRTTSAVAGASWGPYMVNDPRVLRWSEEARLTFEEIAKEDPSSGVRLTPGLEAAADGSGPPDWALGVRDFHHCTTDELPAGYTSGWRYTIPLVDMPRYLEYLRRRLERAGTTITVGRIQTFGDVVGAARAIVNCTGLTSRTLVGDDAVYPTRGQLVVAENPGITEFFQDNAEGEDLTYFLPHGSYVVLGGSAIPGAIDLEPNPRSAEQIVARCAAIEPRLAHARVIGHRVGLRPARSEVRVERDAVRGVPLIHNYGHGGAGVTLSWGCADEVRRLLFD
jgi:D-amino-acid oxidase